MPRHCSGICSVSRGDFGTMRDAVTPAKRFTAASVAALVTAALVSACGGGSRTPSTATAAVVAGAPITVATLDHWIGITVNSSNPTSTLGTQPTPIPPDFTACVSYHRANDPKAASAPTLTAAELKNRCRQTYRGALSQTLSFLIMADYIQGEAAADGITISNATLGAQLAQAETATVKQGKVPTVPALQRYLASLGETGADELFRIKIASLSADLTARAVAAAPKVTAAQVAAYYKAHKPAFGHLTLGQARVKITATLSENAKRTTSAAFVNAFDAKWLNLTTCSPAYVVVSTPPVCRNAPATPTSSLTTTTG